jgi:hypothetical protein
VAANKHLEMEMVFLQKITKQNMYRWLLTTTAMTFAVVMQDEVRPHFTTSK